MTIAHLSDLHFTGGLTREYFEQVIDETNALDCDWTLVTGDILDTNRCLEWVPHTVGKLRARHGVLFVLGNHDRRRADAPRLRRLLTECGLVDVGGKWIERNYRGAPIVFAGTEVPWFRPAPDLSHAPPPRRDGGPFRILLSHSPDQYGWAKRRQFDLMFAGHTHGGQVRLPLIGALVAPSVHGTKYAAGVFDEPPTVLHVTRGIAGLQPIRINCPPELTRLTLTCASDASRSKARADEAVCAS
jgi:predicted MPP superfamily phosphohydrolase